MKPDGVNRGAQARAAQCFPQQEQHAFQCTGRLRETHFHDRFRHVFVMTYELEFLHACLAQIEVTLQFQQQSARGKQQRLRFMHQRRQFQTAGKAGRWQKKFARFGQAAQCAVHLVQQTLAKASRHARPWKIQAFAQGMCA